MKRSSLLLAATVSIAGCDKPEITRYEIPKEKPRPVLGSEPAPSLPPSTPGSTPTPSWTAPKAWEEGTASPTRLASYSAKGENGGLVDISVTTFPGDVGGEEANLSRWRTQIGIRGEAAPTVPETVQAGPLEGQLYDLSGPLARTMICWFRHEGNSWFFKMTGDSDAVEEQKPAFLAFIGSVRFDSAEP